ncbi:MAG: di-trans,poly-cis-decaprenylcistransferase [Oscillospiraceae bacterium]|nr:di-trans,poly-cis-decaprenylcistransferase [Oscillospiraceae bacterium]
MAFFEKSTKEAKSPIPPEQLPKHVGFIMDGNGRWAKKRGMPRGFGHAEGGKVYKKIMTYCRDIGIPYASFYVFSTENWSRSQAEIEGIFKLMRQYLDDVQGFKHEGVRWMVIGDKTPFPQDIRERMIQLEEDTKDNTRLTCLMCCNYGGRAEIAHSAREIAELVKAGKLNPEDITEETLSDHLYTAGMPDVDLVIRPSGELRLSNYLIWQCAYAEYYFTDILWPDFTTDDLDKALIDYAGRGRRFGGAE